MSPFENLGDFIVKTITWKEVKKKKKKDNLVLFDSIFKYLQVIFSEIDVVLFPKMRGYEEIGDRSFYERSVYFSIRMKHLMIFTSLIILIVIGIGVGILFIVENNQCKYLIMHVFILFITCQQPILNSESTNFCTNFYHLFFPQQNLTKSQKKMDSELKIAC